LTLLSIALDLLPMSFLQHYFIVLVALLSLFQVVFSSTSFSYTPVTALDRYGNSVQLQNAREAAARHGRLIVAAKSTENNAIVVISVYTPKLGQLPSSTTRPGVLEHVWTDGCAFLACTGVKADAMWLTQTMRQYSKRLWDRYDVSSMSQERMTQALSQTLLEFMGYKREKEWQDGVGVGDSTSGEEEPLWARPLGIQTLIISPTSPIVLVEPSGVAQSLEYVAVGKNSDAVMRALRERYSTDGATVDELKELLVDVIRQQVEGQKQSTELIIEVVSEKGVKVSSISLRSAR